jgi:ribonuclease HI
MTMVSTGEDPKPFTPKQVLIVVGISGYGNAIGKASYSTVLKYMENVKWIECAYLNSLPTRVTLLGAIAGVKALKGSCEVTVVVQNELVVRAFEQGWILDWEKKGLLKRKSTRVKHTDLYAQLYEAMDGHAIQFRQPATFEEEMLMEQCKKVAKKRKQAGPWGQDTEQFESDGGLFVDNP